MFLLSKLVLNKFFRHLTYVSSSNLKNQNLFYYANFPWSENRLPVHQNATMDPLLKWSSPKWTINRIFEFLPRRIVPISGNKTTKFPGTVWNINNIDNKRWKGNKIQTLKLDSVKSLKVTPMPMLVSSILCHGKGSFVVYKFCWIQK